MKITHLGNSTVYLSMQYSKRVQLSSGSMEPILADEKVIIKRTPSKNIQINDIVVIMDQGKYLAKRVLYKNKGALIIKADRTLKSTNYFHDTIYKLIKVSRNRKNHNPEDIYKVQNILYSEELNTLNSALHKQSVNFLFLKGLPLNMYITRKPPRRLYADCDLLVHKKHLALFESIVNSLGFKREASERLNTPNLFKHKITEISFVKRIGNFPIILDVHAEVVFMMNETAALNELFPQSTIDDITSSFLRNKRLVKVGNQKFPILSDLNLVFYLALHIFHHNYKGYNNYHFFDLVFRKTNIKLQKLKNLINKTRTNNFLYPVFKLYKKYYNPALTKEFLEDLRQSQNIIYSTDNINIFDEQSRITAGLNRFGLLLILSPYPLIKKVTVFFNPSVIFSFFLLVFDIFLTQVKKIPLSSSRLKVFTNQIH